MAGVSLKTPPLEGGALSNFSGGPNFRDAPLELAASEAFAAWNVTFDERGGVSSRLGYEKRNADILGDGTVLVVNDFYSKIAGVFLTQVGPKLYADDDTTAVHTFTTAACVTYAEIDGKIVVAHPDDGLFTSTDGTTWTPLDELGTCTIDHAAPALVHLTAHGRVVGDTVTFSTTGTLPSPLTAGTTYYVISAGLTSDAFEIATSSGGTAINTTTDGTGVHTLHTANVPATANCIVAWQSKLFVGLDDGTVHWSALGDLTRWSATDFNAIWTLDQEAIVALAVGSGQDIQGRPGLLVFKQESVYRINNAATGAYTVVSSSEGAGGPKAVVGVGSRVCWIGQRGIFWWREDQAAPVPAGERLQPLWQATQLSFANQAGWAAGRFQDRALFSCSTLNSPVNDIAFEFMPDQGWITPRSDAVTCYANAVGDVGDHVCGGSPTVEGQAYNLFVTGADDGVAIDWYIQTRWLQPNGGYQATLWQLRMHGRGSGTMTVRRDEEASGGTEFPFDLATPGPHYDDGLLYDNGVIYGTAVYQETQAMYDLGTLRQFSLLFSGSSSTTVAGRELFGNAPAPNVGAFALFSLEYLFTPLGLS